MKLSRRLLFLASFLGLAATAALAVARTGSPSPAPLLLAAVAAGTLAGAAGLVTRRAAPAALALVPLGLFLLWRAQLSPPPFVHGIGGQLGFYLGHVRAGVDIYMQEGLPFHFAALPDLGLLLSTAVYLATALAAVAALSLRRVLPAIVILLVPLGFGLTVDQTGRVLWLPLAFLSAAGCLLLLSRSLARGRWRSADALAAAATVAIAALGALLLLASTSVAAGRPWQDWRTWGPISTTKTTRLVFNWMDNYPRLLDPRTDARVMTVTSPVPSYWRANALDAFTGTTWFSSSSYQRRVSGVQTSGGTVYTVPPLSPQPPGQIVSEVFTTTSMYTEYILSGGSLRTLTIAGGAPLFTGAAGSVAVEGQLGPRLQYAVTAVVPELTPEDLVGRGRAYPQDILQYTALPFPHLADLGGGAGAAGRWRRAVGGTTLGREWLGLYGLDRRIVGSATDPYQIALRIEQYLRTYYAYTLTPPATSDQSPYAAFLFRTRQGYCQHFAGSMAVLLRFNGIPARVAVGFTTGRRIGRDTYAVRRSDAHSWVEAYFPGIGWVPFDPTPGSNLPGPGASSTNAGFVDPYTTPGAAGRGVLPLPPVPARRNPQQDPASGQHAGGTAGPAPRPQDWWLPWLAATAAAIVAWPAARLAWRRLRARRGDADRRLRASLDLLVAELRDYGVDVPPSQTLEETAAVLRSRLGVDAAGVVGRVQAVVFGGRQAAAEDVAAVTDLRAELRRRLRRRAGLRARLAAGYGVRVAAARPISR